MAGVLATTSMSDGVVARRVLLGGAGRPKQEGQRGLSLRLARRRRRIDEKVSEKHAQATRIEATHATQGI